MANIVLFGAGASHGSGNVLPYAPPLGNGLFLKLLEIKGVNSLIPEKIQKTFERNFEEGMAEYVDYMDGNTMSFQRILAGYLAKFVPLEQNNYIKIVQTLNSSRVIYSSLNYDLLLELSVGCLGRMVRYSSKPHLNDIRILKLHGSCNFWPDIPAKFTNCTFSGVEGADIVSPIVVLNRPETLRRCATEDSIAPAMARFAVGKKVAVCPDAVSEQYEMWKHQVKKSSKIFIIGVRVHEVDEHIWGLLGKCSAHVHYFGFPNDRQEFETWKENNKKNTAFFHQTDFEGAINIINSYF